MGTALSISITEGMEFGFRQLADEGKNGVRSAIGEAAIEGATRFSLERKRGPYSGCWMGRRGGIMNLMSKLLLQHALQRLLALPEEKQKEHAEAILERLEEDAVYIE